MHTSTGLPDVSPSARPLPAFPSLSSSRKREGESLAACKGEAATPYRARSTVKAAKKKSKIVPTWIDDVSYNVENQHIEEKIS